MVLIQKKYPTVCHDCKGEKRKWHITESPSGKITHSLKTCHTCLGIGIVYK